MDFAHTPAPFHTTPFSSIHKMMVRAQRGLSFPVSAIMRGYPRIVGLSQIAEDIYAAMELFSILYELSKCEATELASTAFAKVEVGSDSVANWTSSMRWGSTTCAYSWAATASTA